MLDLRKVSEDTEPVPPITLRLDGRVYTWDGECWCDSSGLEPPLALIPRLATLLAEQHPELARRPAAEPEPALPAGRPLRILVTGARTWTDRAAVERELGRYPAGSVLIHGDARGADRLAGEVGAALGFSVTVCPAEWARFGRGAGIERNRTMLRDHKPDLVIAFHPDLEQARGTRHMVAIARKAGVPVRVVTGREGRE